MSKLSIKYPWQRLEKGQGFFIPCLDPQQIYEDGLKAAIVVRVLDAHAKIGIKDGRLGVLFVRGQF